MRKAGAVGLSVCLAAGMLAGCGKKNQSTASTERVTLTEEIESVMPEFDDIFEPAAGEAGAGSDTDTVDFDEFVGEDGAEFTADYLMIYNPKIYDEHTDMSDLHTSEDVLATGRMADQIVTGSDRAGGEFELEPKEFTYMDQNDERIQTDDSDLTRDSVRATAKDPAYSKGDKHDFWYNTPAMDSRVKGTFECLYAGQKCYVWAVNGSISPRQAEAAGREMDRNIYDKDESAFGTPRFTENGGKLNILFYPIDGGICGFFAMYDIWSTAELAAAGYTPDDLCYNTDHAIININSNLVGNYDDVMYSTLAHEMQHLICASDAFNYVDTPFMRTWLNESMSAYAEELVYPGTKVECQENLQFYVSENYKNGQSLYNFSTADDEYLGAYGIVYLFEEYLREQSANDPLFNIHEFWRTSCRADIDEAQATNSAAADGFIGQIDKSVTYTSAMKAGLSSTDEWLSKLTLNFYLETLKDDLADLDIYADPMDGMSFGEYMRLYSLYTNVDPASIEGGGRVMVMTQNGTYKVPADASNGLIYVTLDKDFNCTGIYDSVGTPLQ